MNESISNAIDDLFPVFLTSLLVLGIWMGAYVFVQGQADFDKNYIQNPEKTCVENYGNLMTRSIPAKCLKYFK